MLPLRAEVLRREAALRLEELPGWENTVIGELLGEVHHPDERIVQYDMHIRTMARQFAPAQQLMRLMGLWRHMRIMSKFGSSGASATGVMTREACCLARGTCMSSVTQAPCDHVGDDPNRRPRKHHGFKTSNAPYQRC